MFFKTRAPGAFRHARVICLLDELGYLLAQLVSVPRIHLGGPSVLAHVGKGRHEPTQLKGGVKPRRRRPCELEISAVVRERQRDASEMVGWECA
tara:strand:+ start:157 stop:438 length:282 start_codon:yes stop_codon:yes gene_type:complete